jgi:hypothetical protein
MPGKNRPNVLFEEGIVCALSPQMGKGDNQQGDWKKKECP